ncbi:class F sortase [Allosalinactinospora lopnorensis]|uniref:class F sortase n=1 Tax=Allosalinactinospora lopnorensis TaxID=1352348 RepID=UPI000697E4EE|nr:class F sortase [Allosalinactinospora lopnorensis]
MSNASKRSGGRGPILAAIIGGLTVLGAAVLGLSLFVGSDGQLKTSDSPPEAGAEAGSGGDSSTEQGGESGDGSSLERSEPTGLTIPAIDVEGNETIPLGLQDSGEIEVPEDNTTIGWYEDGPTPGQFGPAVMGAHVDLDGQPGIFYDLGKLESGDEVMVDREDGTTAVFNIYSVEQHPKDNFPTQEVYAPTGDQPELRLVTCGGTFDEDSEHYSDNIIVYAEMTDVR